MTEEYGANADHIDPASLLREWTERGYFESRVHEHIESLRQPEHGGSTFYTRAMASGDPERAERELNEHANGERWMQVAYGIEAVIDGMRHIAFSGIPNLPSVEVSPLSKVKWPKPDLNEAEAHDAKMVLMMNNHILSSKLSAIFGAAGSLGIQMVTACANPYDPRDSQLCLVLPSDKINALPDDNVVVRFDMSGQTKVFLYETRYHPRLNLLRRSGRIDDDVLLQERNGVRLTDDLDLYLKPGFLPVLRCKLMEFGSYLSNLTGQTQTNRNITDI